MLPVWCPVRRGRKILAESFCSANVLPVIPGFYCSAGYWGGDLPSWFSASRPSFSKRSRPQRRRAATGRARTAGFHPCWMSMPRGDDRKPRRSQRVPYSRFVHKLFTANIKTLITMTMQNIDIIWQSLKVIIPYSC